MATWVEDELPSVVEHHGTPDNSKEHHTQGSINSVFTSGHILNASLNESEFGKNANFICSTIQLVDTFYIVKHNIIII